MSRIVKVQVLSIQGLHRAHRLYCCCCDVVRAARFRCHSAKRKSHR